jgi:hypothetical protein
MKHDSKEPDRKGEQFDPSRLRLTQNFAEIAGVKKALITVPVRKPSRQSFIRTHPDSNYWLETAVIELKEDRDTYLVDPSLWNEIPLGEVAAKVLVTTVDRQGVLSLWPIRMPDPTGLHDEWSRSALECAQMARDAWIRVAANTGLGAYEAFHASGDFADPEWPDIKFAKILEIAFRDRFIKDLSHPVLRRLRGEV